MRRLIVLIAALVIAFSLVFTGCDMIKGLFGSKTEGQAPVIGAPPQSPDLTAASVNGKYYNLLKTLNVPGDQGSYGSFYDWGYYSGTSWAGYNNLPPGYWVYVYPNWYIWGNMK